MPKDNHCPGSDSCAGPSGLLNDDQRGSVDGTRCSDHAVSEPGHVHGRRNTNSRQCRSCGSNIPADGQTNVLGLNHCTGNVLRGMTGHYRSRDSPWISLSGKDTDSGTALRETDNSDNVIASHGTDMCDGTDSQAVDVTDMYRGKDSVVNNICDGETSQEDKTCSYEEGGVHKTASLRTCVCHARYCPRKSGMCTMDPHTDISECKTESKSLNDIYLHESEFDSFKTGVSEKVAHEETLCDESNQLKTDLCGEATNEKSIHDDKNITCTRKVFLYCVSCRTERVKQYCYPHVVHGYHHHGTYNRTSECNLHSIKCCAPVCDGMNDLNGFINGDCFWWKDETPTSRHDLPVSMCMHTVNTGCLCLAEYSNHNDTLYRGLLGYSLQCENPILACCYVHHGWNHTIWPNACHHRSWLGSNCCHGDSSGPGNLQGFPHSATEANARNCANDKMHTGPISGGKQWAATDQMSRLSDNVCDWDTKLCEGGVKCSTGLSDLQCHEVTCGHHEPHGDEGHVCSTAHRDAQSNPNVGSHVNVRGHRKTPDVPTYLYMDYYHDMKVSDEMLNLINDREWISKMMDAIGYAPSHYSEYTDLCHQHGVRLCDHDVTRQVVAQETSKHGGDATSCHDVTSDSKSPIICVGLPKKSGFTSDSAYCSLERHANAVDYLILRVVEGNHTENCREYGSSDGDIEEDSGTEECSSDTEDTLIIDAQTYTRDKLNQRTTDMLTVLRDQFSRLIQEVSEQLVKLLQERHELKEQVDMRKIAIEQLVRFQANTTQHTSGNIRRSLVVSGDE